MLCRYELSVRAICPIHKVVDCYALTVESPHEVLVEKLLEFVATLATVEQTQEQITESIAARFPNTEVMTEGWHSGVKVTVMA